MITKIELKEKFSNFDTSFLIIDLSDKNIKRFKNDVIIEEKNIELDTVKSIDLIKKYTTYWDNEYIDETVIDGIISELYIYVNDEIIKYSFKNKFPFNYHEFIKLLKEMVYGI